MEQGDAEERQMTNGFSPSADSESSDPGPPLSASCDRLRKEAATSTNTLLLTESSILTPKQATHNSEDYQQARDRILFASSEPRVLNEVDGNVCYVFLFCII